MFDIDRLLLNKIFRNNKRESEASPNLPFQDGKAPLQRPPPELLLLWSYPWRNTLISKINSNWMWKNNDLIYYLYIYFLFSYVESPNFYQSMTFDFFFIKHVRYKKSTKLTIEINLFSIFFFDSVIMSQDINIIFVGILFAWSSWYKDFIDSLEVDMHWSQILKGYTNHIRRPNL